MLAGDAPVEQFYKAVGHDADSSAVAMTER
jgi:hypothetical protein